MNRFVRISASGFYSGYFPVAPGTFGTIAAAALLFLLNYFFSNIFLLSGVLFGFSLFLGLWSAGRYERLVQREDPQEVVIDEWAGYYLTYWLVLFFIPNSYYVALAVFLFFRLMDILKPFPINRSQRLGGARGIMIDDLLAAVYAALLIIFCGKFFEIC